MQCPDELDLIRDLDGQLSVNRHRELESHFAGCSGCRAKRQQLGAMIARIGPTDDEFEQPALADEVMRRVRHAAPAVRPRWHSSLRFAVPALAGAAFAVLAALLLVPGQHRAPPSASSAFSARGGDDPNPERWVSLWLFVRDGDTYRPAPRRIAADARLVFGYRNQSPDYRHAMIFAVGSEGQVHWYYPAYEQAGSDPSSVQVQQGKHELRDEVQHELRPGPLELFAVFSAQPLRVSTIEREIATAIRRHGKLPADYRLPLEGTGQLRRRLTVEREGNGR